MLTQSGTDEYVWLVPYLFSLALCVWQRKRERDKHDVREYIKTGVKTLLSRGGGPYLPLTSSGCICQHRAEHIYQSLPIRTAG